MLLGAQDVLGLERAVEQLLVEALVAPGDVGGPLDLRAQLDQVAVGDVHVALAVVNIKILLGALCRSYIRHIPRGSWAISFDKMNYFNIIIIIIIIIEINK